MGKHEKKHHKQSEKKHDKKHHSKDQQKNNGHCGSGRHHKGLQPVSRDEVIAVVSELLENLRAGSMTLSPDPETFAAGESVLAIPEKLQWRKKLELHGDNVKLAIKLTWPVDDTETEAEPALETPAEPAD